jgi:hypothetical protein
MPWIPVDLCRGSRLDYLSPDCLHPSQGTAGKFCTDALCLDGNVQCAHRLVTNQEGWVERQGPGDRDPLALAAGELVRVPLCCVPGETDLVQQGLNPAAPFDRSGPVSDLGSAIAASVATGLHPDLTTAADAMVRVNLVVKPDAKAHERYKPLVGQYEETYECLKDASHRLVQSLG